MATFHFLRWQPPPLPATFGGFPYTLYPRFFFFHQNDRKGCTLDYQVDLGHSLLVWGQQGQILEGMVTKKKKKKKKHCLGRREDETKYCLERREDETY